MIQDILPHQYDNSFKQPELTKNSFLLYIHQGTILLKSREAEKSGEQQEEREEKDGMIRSFLTGQMVPAEQADRRPIAIMMSNDKEARPQYGINRAGVVYEAEETGLIPELSKRAEYLFSIDEIPYFMVRSAEGDPALKLEGEQKLSFQGTAYFRIMQPEYQAFAAVTAVQLFRWKESRKFCLQDWI